ncbi:MAG: Lrp/AsnC family transcriptional regulator [Actinomycetota bacterium]
MSDSTEARAELAGRVVDLDDVDRRLLLELRRDARASVNELAGLANVSRSTAYQRLERMRRQGVLGDSSVEVDPEAVGLDVAAMILIDLEQGSWRDLLDDLRSLPGLEHLAFTTGAFDAVALVRVAGVHALRDVVLDHLLGLESVRSTQTVFVLDEWRADPVAAVLEGA